MRVWIMGAALVSCVALTQTAQAGTIDGGSGLLTPKDELQLEAWLGEGSLTVTNVFSHRPGDEKTSSDFHDAVDQHGRTFTIIEVDQGGRDMVIGGYDPRSWDSHSGYHLTPDPTQRTAFIFNLTTGDLQRQQTTPDEYSRYYRNFANYQYTYGEDRKTNHIEYDYTDRVESQIDPGLYQTFNFRRDGPVFGEFGDIAVSGDLELGSTTHYSYGKGGPSWFGSHDTEIENFPKGPGIGPHDGYVGFETGYSGESGTNILGGSGTTYTALDRIDVFTIQAVVPEPASLGLILIAGVCAIRRRKAHA